MTKCPSSRTAPYNFLKIIEFASCYTNLPHAFWSTVKQTDHRGFVPEKHLEQNAPDSVKRSAHRLSHSLDTFKYVICQEIKVEHESPGNLVLLLTGKCLKKLYHVTWWRQWTTWQRGCINNEGKITYTIIKHRNKHRSLWNPHIWLLLLCTEKDLVPVEWKKYRNCSIVHTVLVTQGIIAMVG